MRGATERTAAKDGSGAARAERWLTLVLDASHLEAGGLRVSLSTPEPFAELTIGRGDARVLERPSPRRASLFVPDGRMSEGHARLVRRDAAWFVVDETSTNGTTLNGKSVTDAKLGDGDVLGLGQSVFVYREQLPEGRRRAVGDLDSTSLSGTTPGLATLDPQLSERFARLARVAASPLATMLLGETGTGKEVLARAIHQLSKRPGPFVAVNCGAIPNNLVESHLFGHVRGSFSGAVRDEPGVVRATNHGTLLLDEIGDLPPSSQAALLRVLQEGEVLPVGSAHPVKVDVRIVSATHRPLDELVEKGAFRQDLFARLAGYVFAVPPLRERIADLGLLVAAILPRLGGGTALRLHRDVAQAFVRHDWPMNVRELEQCLRAASVLAEDGLVTLDDLPKTMLLREEDEPGDVGSAASDDELRRELLVRLADARGNIADVARAMGKARQQVQRWLKRLGIDPEPFRTER